MALVSLAASTQYDLVMAPSVASGKCDVKDSHFSAWPWLQAKSGPSLPSPQLPELFLSDNEPPRLSAKGNLPSAPFAHYKLIDKKDYARTNYILIRACSRSAMLVLCYSMHCTPYGEYIITLFLFAVRDSPHFIDP
ncbi:hypothetical protein I7I51_08710 [Histoplasma capsulatum]|uniref:Uncharacterized protein n=1 Tax=Ajellomyces capsulatus TaxID=5037 RepID=A0A8A1M502_AJECA|nr:hypothetical protein I7I51_08710 [Histoplasma capsulatum]